MAFWPVLDAPSLAVVYMALLLGPFTAFYLAARLVEWFRDGL